MVPNNARNSWITRIFVFQDISSWDNGVYLFRNKSFLLPYPTSTWGNEGIGRELVISSWVKGSLDSSLLYEINSSLISQGSIMYFLDNFATTKGYN